MTRMSSSRRRFLSSLSAVGSAGLSPADGWSLHPMVPKSSRPIDRQRPAGFILLFTSRFICRLCISARINMVSTVQQGSGGRIGHVAWGGMDT